METFAKSGKKEVKMASNKFIWPIADLKHCTFGRLELCYSDSCKYEEKCRILSSNVNIQKPRLDNMKSHYKHGKHIVVESRPLNIMQVWLELKIRRMALPPIRETTSQNSWLDVFVQFTLSIITSLQSRKTSHSWFIESDKRNVIYWFYAI